MFQTKHSTRQKEETQPKPGARTDRAPIPDHANAIQPDDYTAVGAGRNIKDGRSMKTSEQVADGGNLEERDDPMANNDSPVLRQNITDINLRPGAAEKPGKNYPPRQHKP